MHRKRSRNPRRQNKESNSDRFSPPPSLPMTNSLPDFFSRINTFDESSRVRRQTRRHGFNLRTDSNRFPRGAYEHRFLYTRTHIRAQMLVHLGPRGATGTLTRNVRVIYLARSSNPLVSSPLLLSFSLTLGILRIELRFSLDEYTR